MAEPIRVGDRATIEHAFSSADVEAFARLSGDDNPISRLLGTRLPGPGTILLGQELRYRRPVYAGDTLRATIEVTNVREDKPVFVLRTWVEPDEVVLDGEATVLLWTR